MKRHKVTSKYIPRTNISALRLYTGLFSRVAAQLGVSRSVVARVAKGNATSARITRALLQERSRIESFNRKSSGRKERVA